MRQHTSHKGITWIIGASTGIGAALAERIADKHHGKHLIISARNEKTLGQLASRLSMKYGCTCHVMPFDISGEVPEQELAAYLGEHPDYRLEEVVINAGICEYLDSDNLDLDAAERVMSTNYLGPMRISRAVLPFLRDARSTGLSPNLVFVSSSVTYQSLPRAHAYGASKAALRYFAECLKIDLQTEQIKVQVVSPGFVDTPLTQKNDFPMPMIISSEEAAEKIYAGMRSNTFDISFPKGFVWGLKVFAALPTRLKFKMLAGLSRHPEAELASDLEAESKPEKYQAKGTERKAL